MQIDQKNIRPMMASDLATVLAWRNHPEVRRYMFSQQVISADEHSLWFDKASNEPGRHLLLYVDNSTALGFININEIASGGVAEWGFYVSPNAPKGTGRALGNAAVQYSFLKVGLHKLCGQVLAFNELSKKFHVRLGFSLEGVLEQQHFDGQSYHDIFCFGLLVHKWRVNT
jgi:UDP-4-amino-4,6-dideoxy-N-acetyl-beta-L-altrosamine N-acetyltransferase